MQRHALRVLTALSVTSALAVGSLVVAAPASAAATTTVYVSPTGNDSANGSTSGTAFHTLTRAQQAVRDANGSGNVTVVLADGTYPLTQPLKFGTADGGRNGNSVTWKAADGAKPVISGGKTVTGWSDANNDGIWEASLNSAIDFRQLYVDGAQALRSRMWVDYGKFSFSRSGFTVDSGYVSSGQVGDAWAKLKALPAAQQKRVELRSRASFTDRFAPFSSISNNVVTMRQPSWDNQTWGWDTINKPLHSPAFSMRNALAFVDENNEWFYDTDAKKLYYKPNAGVNPNNISIVAPQMETLVQISGDSAASQVGNLSFEGLSFQHSSDTSANGDDGYASQQNGSVLRGYLYALTDPATGDLPTSDQRQFDPANDQAPLVRTIRKDSAGTYRYIDDNSVVATADQNRLIRLRDYPTMPLNDVQLAAWNQNNPNNQKRACAQGTYSIDCLVFESNRNLFLQTPAAVQVSAAKNVSFTRNEFTHLGSKGLGIGMNDEAHASGVGLGAQNVSVVGNTFFDIAGSAIVAGGTTLEAARPSEARANKNITVSNNRVKKMGQDYFESSAILATYIDGAEISNNELSDGPYDVVDTGWGWGVPDAGGNAVYQGRGSYIFWPRFADNNPTIARNMHVAKNVMWDFKKEGNDGGVLYHLGAAPGSSWDSNYLRGGDGTKLYFDEGTRYMTAKNNALDDTYYQVFANGFNENQGTPADNVGNSTRDNTIDGTWWLGGGINAGPWCANSAKCDARGQYYNNRITNNSQLGIEEFPLAAQKVVAESGIQAQYRKQGDFVGQPRGLDLSMARDASGAQILTATIANFGSVRLTDIAVQVSAPGATLTSLTAAPASLEPGVTGTATWKISGPEPITSATVSANVASTRQEFGATTRETVNKSLSVVLGGSIGTGLLTAAPANYAENQAVQTDDLIALQNKGRDIGEGGDEYTTAYKKDILASGGSVTTKFEGATSGYYRAGISVRNDLSKMANAASTEKSLGYAHLAIEPNFVALRYDADGDGVIDSQAAAAATTTRPIWVRLTRTDDTVTAAYSSDGTNFTNLGQAPLTGADASLDAGVVQSSAGRAGNSGELGTSIARYSALRFSDGTYPADSEAAQQQILDAKKAQRDNELNIDSFAAWGNSTQESARNLKTLRSNSGTWLNQQYRDADRSLGSFFQMEMTVDPQAPKNYLGVRYNGGDAGRSFDVLLNGTKLKSEVVNNSQGGGFYTQWDEIPASILQGIAAADSYKKNSSGSYVLDANGNKIPVVTVRFEANGTSFVGGAYGLFTARALGYATDAKLSKLSFDTGTLSPAFSGNTKAYTLKVPADTESVTFDADPAVPSGLVKLGDVLIDDTKTRTVTLVQGGTTRITLNSFAQDHSTTTQYVVDVVRQAPAPQLSVTATASSRCVAGKVLLTVTVKNTSTRTVNASASTPWGTQSSANLAADKSTSFAFSTRAGSIVAGQATGTVSATIDGAPVTASANAAYTARTCGN